jgi:hypothetical protein
MGGAWCTEWRRGVHVGCRGEKLKERDHWERLGVDGRIILKWFLKK